MIEEHARGQIAATAITWPVGVLEHGPALRGAAHDGRVTCLVDGRLANRDVLARELGQDPASAPEEVLAAHTPTATWRSHACAEISSC